MTTNTSNLAIDLAAAIAKDAESGQANLMAEGKFGPAVSGWLSELQSDNQAVNTPCSGGGNLTEDDAVAICISAGLPVNFPWAYTDRVLCAVKNAHARGASTFTSDSPVVAFAWRPLGSTSEASWQACFDMPMASDPLVQGKMEIRFLSWSDHVPPVQKRDSAQNIGK